MIRYFCDKCGKEIGQYEGMKVKWEMGTSQLAFKPWDGDNEGGYDLCNECSSEFKGWIENADGMDSGEAAGAE